MRKRGELKRLALESLGDALWHRPSQIAETVHFQRRSQLHAYLLRLCDCGLVERAPERGISRYIYRLSDRGCRLLLLLYWRDRDRGWLSPSAWAVLAGFYPVRASYTYLKRLHKWKLVDRSLDRRGLLLYRLSRRGRARLAWLRNGGQI